MHKISISFFFLLLLGCNQSAKTVKNSDPLEAGREFINASLTGDYDYAKKYLLADSTNLMYFDRFIEFDTKKPTADKEVFKNANGLPNIIVL